MNAADDPVPHIRSEPVAEQLKYCAARYAYLHRDEDCPRKFNGTAVRWGRWFNLVFKQSLDSYIKQRREKAPGRVL